MGKQGFTLIELLVTITIISILSIVGIVSYQGISAKARDTSRKQDLNNLSTALEIYFQKTGKYIVNSDDSDLTNCQTDPESSTFYNSIRSNITNGIVPVDPSSKLAYCYISQSISQKTGQSYMLCAKLENTSDPDRNDPGSCGVSYNYRIVPK